MSQPAQFPHCDQRACVECVGHVREDAEQGERVRRCERHQANYSGARCPECAAKWRTDHSLAPERRRELAKAQLNRVAACRAYVRQVKSQPCMDYYHGYPWYVMDFDHRNGRGDGDAKVSSLIGQGNLDRIKAEIAKCDLLCANCHKIRTHERAVERGERIA